MLRKILNYFFPNPLLKENDVLRFKIKTLLDLIPQPPADLLPKDFVFVRDGSSLKTAFENSATHALASETATFLEQQNAVNYIEVQLIHPKTHNKYLVTLQRQPNPTPHALRRQAEQKLHIATAAIRLAESILTSDPEQHQNVVRLLKETLQKVEPDETQDNVPL